MFGLEYQVTSNPTPQHPVTLDDVRAALDGVDPRTTNAGALRAKLGRGSVSTIQKHLDKLRAELTPTVADETSTPPAPADAVAAIWGAAWSAAQAQTERRLNLVTQERDAAREQLALRTSDLEAMSVEFDKTVDVLANTIAEVRSRLAETEALGAAAATEATARADQLAAELAAVRAELDSVRRDAAHAAELAKRDGELKDRAHQHDREHLLNQIAELKSALHRPEKRA